MYDTNILFDETKLNEGKNGEQGREREGGIPYMFYMLLFPPPNSKKAIRLYKERE